MYKLDCNLECIAACEVLPRSDCRRPSYTFTQHMPSEAAKPPKPITVRGLDLKSIRSILVNNTNSCSCCVFAEGILKVGRALEGRPLWKVLRRRP